MVSRGGSSHGSGLHPSGSSPEIHSVYALLVPHPTPPSWRLSPWPVHSVLRTIERSSKVSSQPGSPGNNHPVVPFRPQRKCSFHWLQNRSKRSMPGRSHKPDNEKPTACLTNRTNSSLRPKIVFRKLSQ